MGCTVLALRRGDIGGSPATGTLICVPAWTTTSIDEGQVGPLALSTAAQSRAVTANEEAGPMATTDRHATGIESLQTTARRHLWLHFSRMGAYSDEAEIPIIVRGEGCYLYDEHGNRYFDGLSALF